MSLKIYSWNINGIRACVKAGFLKWLESSDADVVLLQEVRALPEQLNHHVLEAFGFKSIWHSAEKKGYSGVAIYSRIPINDKDIVIGTGYSKFDSEGRFMGILHDNIFICNAYFPNSQPEGKRLDYKLAFCNQVQQKLLEYKKNGFSVILGGDINIAHKEIDLANPKQNTKNPGFLLEERQWVSTFLETGYLDSFRLFEQAGGHYTWWSNRPGVRARNIGWRIDSHFISADLKSRVKSAQIHPDVFGSDHCPISLELF